RQPAARWIGTGRRGGTEQPGGLVGGSGLSLGVPAARPDGRPADARRTFFAGGGPGARPADNASRRPGADTAHSHLAGGGPTVRRHSSFGPGPPFGPAGTGRRLGLAMVAAGWGRLSAAKLRPARADRKSVV